MTAPKGPPQRAGDVGGGEVDGLLHERWDWEDVQVEGMGVRYPWRELQGDEGCAHGTSICFGPDRVTPAGSRAGAVLVEAERILAVCGREEVPAGCGAGECGSGAAPCCRGWWTRMCT